MPILVFDVDDTLWENNVLFERVIDADLDWFAHPPLDRAATRAVLDEVERANVGVHGDGTSSFLRSLADCFDRLRERPASERERERAEIESLATALVHREVELMPGVEETLAQLGARHELLLLTKAQTDEQQRKTDASNLTQHFAGGHIVAEKREPTYREPVATRGLTPSKRVPGWTARTQSSRGSPASSSRVPALPGTTTMSGAGTSS